MSGKQKLKSQKVLGIYNPWGNNNPMPQQNTVYSPIKYANAGFQDQSGGGGGANKRSGGGGGSSPVGGYGGNGITVGPSSGQANRGGGGGGSGDNSITSGSGGSGIVIIRYLTDSFKFGGSFIMNFI